MITNRTKAHIDPATMSEADIALFVRGEQFLDKLANLERLLQEAQQAGGPFPTCEEIAQTLSLPVKVIEVMLIGLAAELHYAAGGDVAFLPPRNQRN